MSDVFISYARENSDFVDRLRDALVSRGREAWVDRGGIEPSDRWMQSVREAIERSDAVLFVLSADSLASRVCGEELEHAVGLNKRLIPICIEDLADDVQVPSFLAELSWIMMRPSEDFDAGVIQLVHALDTDLEVARSHTRILVRAKAWELSGRRTSPLLRGEELRAAEDWLSRAGLGRGPEPTDLQRAFIVASRDAATRRQRTLLGSVSAALVIAIGLAIFAFIQRSQAIVERDTAASRALTVSALAQIGQDPERAILLALEAIKRKDTIGAEDALREAVGADHLRAIARPGGLIRTVRFDPGGQILLTSENNDPLARLWSVRTGVSLGVLRGHAGGVSDAEFDPSGHRAVTASLDGTARVWDVRAQRTITVLRGHLGGVGGAVFDASGRHVVTVGADGTARWWDARTGHQLAILRGVGSARSVRPIRAAAFSSPAGVLAVGDAAGTAALWRPASGSLRTLHIGSIAKRDGLAVSPDGRFVAASQPGADGVVHVWRSDWRPVMTIPSPGTPGDLLQSIEFKRDSSLLAVGTAGGAVAVWDVITRQRVVTLPGLGSFVLALGFNRRGELLAAGSDDTARVWALPDGREVSLLSGHSGEIDDARWSPDGTLIATGADDGTARVWEAQPGRRLHAFVPGVSVSPSPDGQTLAVAAGGFAFVNHRPVPAPSALAIVDARTLRTRAFARPPAPVVSLAFAPHSGLIGLATFGPTFLFDPNSGRAVALPDSNGRPDPPPLRPLIAFSPDGRRVIAAQADGGAAEWDVRTHALIQHLPSHAGATVQVAFAPDGRTVASGGKDGTVFIARADGSGRPARIALSGPSLGTQTSELTYSPDGRRLAVAAFGFMVPVFDTRTGRRVPGYEANGPAESVSFSRTGRRVAVGDSTAVSVFDTSSQALEFRARAQDAFAVGFSTDGRILLEGDKVGGSVHLFDTSTGTQLATLAVGVGVQEIGLADHDSIVNVITSGLQWTAYACDVCGDISTVETVAHRLLHRVRLTKAERHTYLTGL